MELSRIAVQPIPTCAAMAPTCQLMQHLQDSPCRMSFPAPEQQKALLLEALDDFRHVCEAAAQCQLARDGVNLPNSC